MAHQLDFLALEDRAKEAESLLGHAIFGEAVRALRQDYLNRMEACPPGQSEALLYNHTKLKVLSEVVTSLQTFVNDYKFAAKKQHERRATDFGKVA
jgi:hypothetical protein